MGPTDFRIFIDLDGVCANWIGKAISTFGINVRSPLIRKALIDDFRGLQQIIDEDFMWDKINAAGPKWWYDIEPFPWANQLYDRMSGMGCVCFLTQPSEGGMAAMGKEQWIRQHFNTRNFLLGAPKELCAGRYSFLIDDSPKKLKEFSDAGGWAIQFPNAFEIEHQCGFDPESIAQRGDKLVDDIVDQIKEIQTRVRNSDIRDLGPRADELVGANYSRSSGTLISAIQTLADASLKETYAI